MLWFPNWALMVHIVVAQALPPPKKTSETPSYLHESGFGFNGNFLGTFVVFVCVSYLVVVLVFQLFLSSVGVLFCFNCCCLLVVVSFLPLLFICGCCCCLLVVVSFLPLLLICGCWFVVSVVVVVVVVVWCCCCSSCYCSCFCLCFAYCSRCCCCRSPNTCFLFWLFAFGFACLCFVWLQIPQNAKFPAISERLFPFSLPKPFLQNLIFDMFLFSLSLLFLFLFFWLIIFNPFWHYYYFWSWFLSCFVYLMIVLIASGFTSSCCCLGNQFCFLVVVEWFVFEGPPY